MPDIGAGGAGSAGGAAAGTGGAGTGGNAGGAPGVAGSGGAGGAQGGSGGQGGMGGEVGLPFAQGVLAAGRYHTCASTSNAVLCWGANNYGELGYELSSGPNPNPNPKLINSEALVGVRQLALGEQHSCALRDDGRVLCWGNNDYGQLGRSENAGTANGNPVPTLVDSAALVGVRQVALGLNHSCALRDDGRVLCWGINAAGQLGTNNNIDTNEPNPVPALLDSSELTGIQQVAAGDGHTCALRDDGRVLCWGLNLRGQLGITNNSGTYDPNPVPALLDSSELTGIRQVAPGGEHTCALRDDGRVLCWGVNKYGQLGVTTNSDTSTPTPAPALIAGGALSGVRQLAVGGDHSCALRDDGRVLCWGDNYSGQLGTSVNEVTHTPNPTPTLINSNLLVGATQLTLGHAHSCALRNDGKAVCWGYNLRGQLGNGTETSSSVLTEVQNLPLLSPPGMRVVD